VRHMGAVLQEMEETLYPAMALRFTEMPVVPEGARQSTMNINSIHGGQAEQSEESSGLPSHCVPDSCRIVIDRRFLVEETLDGVRGEVGDLLESIKAKRDNFEYELRELNHVLPSMTDKSAPVVQTVANAIQSVLGKPAEYVASPGSYDQKHIDRIGKLKNCIAYGPGILELAHKPDEYIGVNDMIVSAKVMTNALVQILVPSK
jgi:succinyl-diaminopimelate desuccinylase